MEATPIIAALIFTYLLNIPFGYWRADSKRRGKRLEWFAAVHAPVPLVFAARLLAGATLTMIPIFVAAFFTGQLTGGFVKKRVSEKLGETGKCLVHDLKLLLAKCGEGSGRSARKA